MQFLYVILLVFQCSLLSTVILLLAFVGVSYADHLYVHLSTREETSALRKQLDTQTKELNQTMRQIEELKEKERIANENVSDFVLAIAVKADCFVHHLAFYDKVYNTLSQEFV